MTGARAYWQLVGLPAVKLTLKYMTMTVFPGGKLVLLRHSHPTSKQHTVLPVLQRCDRPTHTHTHTQLSRRVQQTVELQPLPPECRSQRRAVFAMHSWLRSQCRYRLQ